MCAKQKLIDYYTSCPVQCRTGIYADSLDGTRLVYDVDSASFKPDTGSGKTIKVKKKLMRPIYSYQVSFENCKVLTEIYCAEEINKHGLKWSTTPIYSSEYNTLTRTYTEKGQGRAEKWFAAEKDFDVAELLAELYHRDEKLEADLKMRINAIAFIYSIPFGRMICDRFFVFSCHDLLVFFYSGEYSKLYESETDPIRLRFGLELEFTGISRGSAATVLAKCLGTVKEYIGGVYHKHIVTDEVGRQWMVTRDSSIQPIPEYSDKPEDYYRCELVTPICTVDDIPTIGKIVRALKKRGMKVNSSCGLHIHVDVQSMNEKQIINLVNLMACREELLFKALNVSESRRNRWCKSVDENFLMEINTGNIYSVNDLKKKWYGERARDTSWHYHDSRYHALNLHSLWQNKGVEFRMFNSTDDYREVTAYIHLALAICRHAMTLKRASYESRSRADDKTLFRSWLQQIGLSGERFAGTRKQLMKHFNEENTRRRAA